MKINVVGGGLAGSEACFQLLKRGYEVDLFEMRPQEFSGAHKTDKLAELVCSNSLKSMELSSASGLLKKELEFFDCELLKIAHQCRVEAGGALAVDREMFSDAVEKKLFQFEKFSLIRKEIVDIDFDEPTIIATGPLTSKKLAEKLQNMCGSKNLYFFDAIAPIISLDSIDMNCAWWGGRYNKGGDDYLNLPMDKEEYVHFWQELSNAETVKLKDFEGKEVFEGCMPIEVMAKRGEDSMRFGPMKPVGLYDKNNKKHYAVVQLRKENLKGDALNMVGFQTNLTFGEQKRVFSLIPALKNAEFLRYGVMHRNTFVNSPKLLNDNFRVQGEKLLFVAGQLSGVEGYVESIMSGLWSAVSLARELQGLEKCSLPKDTIMGALTSWVCEKENENFQPMNSNFGILPELKIHVRDKSERKRAYAERSIQSMKNFVETYFVSEN